MVSNISISKSLFISTLVLLAAFLGGCSKEDKPEETKGSTPLPGTSGKKGAPGLSAAPTPGGLVSPADAEARAGSSLKGK